MITNWKAEYCRYSLNISSAWNGFMSNPKSSKDVIDYILKRSKIN